MNPKNITSNLVVAISYFIAGQAGLLLAVPPSNAAAVWPAAGIALAIVLIYGNKILPGILIGGILVQTISFLDFSNTEKIFSSLLIGTVIAAGATCQAWAGAKLVRRLLEQDEALLKERSIILFCLLAGPVSCVISASVGISTLWFREILTIPDLPLAWSTWWIGDSIGVLVFSPVILCLFGKPRNLWQQRINTVAIPLCALTITAFIAFKFSYQQEMQQVEEAFQKNTMQFTQALKNSINSHLETAENIKDFFDSTSGVSAGEFSHFVQPKLSRHSEITALEWAPKVLHKDRESFESHSDIQIRIPNENGEMIDSPIKEIYFPIQFLEPLSGNKNALGFDIGNNPMALKAIEAACSSGKIAVTDAIKLVQETQDQIGIVFYAPVYKKNIPFEHQNNCESLSGFAASVFRLENEIYNIHARLPELKLLVSLTNQSHMFYSDTSETDKSHSIPNQFQFKRVYDLPVANQEWKVIFSPASGFVSIYSSWAIWFIIIGGLLISAFSGIGLLMLTGRTLRTEDLVKLRTSDLENEILARKSEEALKIDQQHVLELISQGKTSLTDILKTVIKITEKRRPDIHAAILYVQNNKLQDAAATNMPDAYNELIDGLEVGPNAGSCGTAAYRGERVIVEDVASDPLWADYSQLGEEYDFRACWSEPVFNASGKIVATFAIYHEKPCVPNDYEIQLIEAMTKLISIAIERKQTEDELQKLSRAVEASPSSIVITDGDGNIEYVNPKFTEVSGYTKEEVLGENPRILQSGETPEAIYTHLWETILAGKEWKGEIQNRKANGDLYWNRSSISSVKDEKGNITHFINIQDDVTHEYELTEQLSYQASHDTLTGLINRHEFERRAKRMLATIKHDKTEHALCFMDLDQFKVVNDTCGHAAGDELLRQLATVLQGSVRQRDTLARLGGDEFGVLMEHCSLNHAHRAVISIQESVQDYQFIWEEQSFRVGVSIGLVAITEAASNLTELLKQADAACYMAKDLGRNRIHIYHGEDASLAQRHGEMQWVTRLYQALEENRFCLYAQTIMPLDNSTNKHYEILIRMVDKNGTIIPPGAFLPAAERYNLIEKLDCWVIENTFRLLAENPGFQEQINFISINLSGQSLTKYNFLQFIISQFDKTGVEGSKICFEITETAAIANLSAAMKFISTLKKLGCRFALDDFGSGLSSFGYLKNLPVDYLKIDGMFVKDIVDDPIDHAMVRSINEIGHIMGMQTIAEFVENDEIKDMLREIGVNYVQGYGIGKPEPLLEILDE